MGFIRLHVGRDLNEPFCYVSILLRVEGACSKGSEAPKDGLARRATCGICACCALATHVLAPPTYDVGKYDRKKANTTQLWQKYGPMATRNHAAAANFNLYGHLPSSWNWIASKHFARLPPPLNPEDLRTQEDAGSQLALEDKNCPGAPPFVKRMAKLSEAHDGSRSGKGF